MKIDAMLEWSAEERTAKEKEWRQALFTLKLQKSTGQLDNPLKLREIRKDIARLKTLDHMDAARAAVLKTHAVHEAAPHAAAAPETATTESAVRSEETVSSRGKKAAAAPKPKGKAAAKGKSAGVKVSGRKTAPVGKPHSPSTKKTSSPSGKAGSKGKSASKKKSK